MSDRIVTTADGATHTRGTPKILLLVENNSVPWDVRVWGECLALRDAGFEVVVLCPRTRTHHADNELREGVSIYRFPVPPSDGSMLGHILEYVFGLWQTRRLLRRLSRKDRFAVVHAANPPDLLLFAALPLRRRGTRFIFDQHDLVPELYLERFGTRLPLLHSVMRGLERLSYALADVVISPNQSYRDIAVIRGRKRIEDVFVVRNAPDPELFHPVPPDESLKRGKSHLIAYVGAMNSQDGVDHAVRALAILKRKRSDWHAIFVGDGDAAASARESVRNFGLYGDVDFSGFVERSEVVRVLSSADVCLSPEPPSPLNEVSTFIKIAEYMAAERPVVAYDLPESRFTAGRAAAYAVPGDVDSFAGRIAELLDDPDRRREMGRLGRNRVLSELSWDHSKAALLAAYERTLSASGEQSAHVAPV